MFKRTKRCLIAYQSKFPLDVIGHITIDVITYSFFPRPLLETIDLKAVLVDIADIINIKVKERNLIGTVTWEDICITNIIVV